MTYFNHFNKLYPFYLYYICLVHDFDFDARYVCVSSVRTRYSTALTATHRRLRGEEGPVDALHVELADPDAQVTVVHGQHAQAALPGADVRLPAERGHGDGVPLVVQRHVVAQGPVHVALGAHRSQRDKVEAIRLGFEESSPFLRVHAS